MLGFLVVDKPKGITSHDVVKEVRKLVKDKVGHCGTLDPLATGVLILSVGKATRLSEYLLKQDKCYLVKGVFGYDSDTYDTDGNIKKVECKKISKEELEATLPKFKGKIKQVPPPFSAVRVKGKRAYELARKGEKVELPEREVEIYKIELIDYNFPEFVINVCCSSGTYIRSLVHDIGKRLGCSAIVSELRRTKIGEITVNKAIKLNQLNKENIAKHLLNPEKILPLPTLSLTEELSLKRFKNGAPLKVKEKDGLYSVLFNEKFIGVGKVKNNVLKAEKVIL